MKEGTKNNNLEEKRMEQVKNQTTKITEIKSELEHAGETCTNPTCPHCKSDNVYGMSRVVGYFSIIDNWNKSKKSELKRRQKGKYWSKDM